ncbi:CDP-glycerol:glycerophosphate glycerophosphotransferase [Staphylococcus pseudintermedius]|uniref:bifunctional glycosyltransferase/CDP-glycerol:glycerophosphate glycerophosphotransferase n=1 Tax=Staphylococcus pseudintermedius TaxID=283734 RepID=UPI003D9B97B8
MKNMLTVILTVYNKEKHIKNSIKSLIDQTNQSFNVVIINDASNDNSEVELFSMLNLYSKNVTYYKLDSNYGHGYARNLGIEKVETPFFMFLDGDDILAPYSIEIYLEALRNTKTLIAPINAFTTSPLKQIDTLNLNIKSEVIEGNEDVFLNRMSVCNIIFSTQVVREHNIRFNNHLNIYADMPFLISYMQSIESYTSIEGDIFYYTGEVYDPFNTEKLTAQAFDVIFKDYVLSFYASLKSVNNDKVRYLLQKQMLDRIRYAFDPSSVRTPQRYKQFYKQLSEVLLAIKPAIKREKKLLFRIELDLLKRKYYKASKVIHSFRKYIRLIKNIVLFKPNKAYSKYKIYNPMRLVKNDTILFESFGGKNYSDSPKYIYEYMKNAYPNLKYYWIFNDISNPELPNDIQKIQKGSSDYYKIFKKARVWVSNSRLPLYLEKKPNQTYIQTWHGTPLKRLANDMKQVRLPETTTELYKRNFYAATRRWDYLISANPYSTEIFQSAFWMAPNKILETGYPRNDILVNHANDTILQQSIKEELNIPKDKKVLLYAPTWRDDEYKEAGHYTFDLPFDLQQFYEQFGDTHVILLRMHYFISNQLSLKDYEDFAIDVSNYNDISRLYLISDCLITDYSSVMFDYGILKRPQLFFPYDIEKYATELRGFYIDYHNDLPGPIYTDPDALIEGLKNIEQIRETYQDQIEAFHQRFCSRENGRAAQYIGDMIYNEIQKSSD